MHLLLVRVGNGKKLVQNRNFAPIIWLYFGVTTILPYFVASSFLLPSATTRRAFKSREWKSDCQVIIHLRTPHFCYFERIPSCPFPENQTARARRIRGRKHKLCGNGVSLLNAEASHAVRYGNTHCMVRFNIIRPFLALSLKTELVIRLSDKFKV